MDGDRGPLGEPVGRRPGDADRLRRDRQARPLRDRGRGDLRRLPPRASRRGRTAEDGPDVSTALLACGGLCLAVGLAAAARDFVNGLGLAGLAVALLVAGYAAEEDDPTARVVIVVGNERQRLSFAADEGVASEFAALATRD